MFFFVVYTSRSRRGIHVDIACVFFFLGPRRPSSSNPSSLLLQSLRRAFLELLGEPSVNSPLFPLNFVIVAAARVLPRLRPELCSRALSHPLATPLLALPRPAAIRACARRVRPRPLLLL